MKDGVNYVAILMEALNSTNGKLAECYRMFHPFSFLNQIKLACQFNARNMNLQPVATYKGWKSKFNRQVKKGAKAFSMLQPAVFQRTDPETQEKLFDKHGNPIMIKVFRLKNMWFAVSDTEGDDIETKLETPSFNFERVLKNLNITRVEYNSTNGNSQGYCEIETGNIAINPVAVNPLKTGCHEVAHSLLHSKKKRVDEIHDDYGLHECEAEGTALILMKIFNLATDEQIENMVYYIKNWMTEAKDLNVKNIEQKCAKNIMFAVDKILKANEQVA